MCLFNVKKSNRVISYARCKFIESHILIKIRVVFPRITYAHSNSHILINIRVVFRRITYAHSTAQKMKFSIKDFFSKCDQIRKKLRIWSHLLKKSLMENFIFCALFE